MDGLFLFLHFLTQEKSVVACFRDLPVTPDVRDEYRAKMDPWYNLT